MKSSILLLAIIALLFQSCATVLSSKTYISVKENAPAGAKVYVNDVFQGETPLTFAYDDSPNSIFKKKQAHILTIKMDGFKTQTVPLQRKLQAGYLLFDFFGWPVFHIIDFCTGALYTYYPKNIKCDMEIEKTK